MIGETGESNPNSMEPETETKTGISKENQEPVKQENRSRRFSKRIGHAAATGALTLAALLSSVAPKDAKASTGQPEVRDPRATITANGENQFISPDETAQNETNQMENSPYMQSDGLYPPPGEIQSPNMMRYPRQIGSTGGKFEVINPDATTEAVLTARADTDFRDNIYYKNTPTPTPDATDATDATQTPTSENSQDHSNEPTQETSQNKGVLGRIGGFFQRGR